MLIFSDSTDSEMFPHGSLNLGSLFSKKALHLNREIIHVQRTYASRSISNGVILA